MRTIRVVSRRSELALAQTRSTIELIAAIRPEWKFVIVQVVTQGDRIQNVPLSQVGGKGLFVTEVEHVIATGDGDMTVHSLKDVPADLAPGLSLAGYPARGEPRDALVSRHDLSLAQLRSGARVGTSSLRRGAQLLAARPDLEIVSVRGNIGTRLRKLETDGLDAVVLAAAGLERMGWQNRVSELLSAEVCLPAVGQGILGIECRADDYELIEALSSITDERTREAALAERTLLGCLEGGCQVPIAGYAQHLLAGNLMLSGLVASLDGQTVLRAHGEGESPVEVGEAVAQQLIDLGAKQIIETATANA